MRSKAAWLAAVVFSSLPVLVSRAQENTSRLIPFSLSNSLSPGTTQAVVVELWDAPSGTGTRAGQCGSDGPCGCGIVVTEERLGRDPAVGEPVQFSWRALGACPLDPVVRFSVKGPTRLGFRMARDFAKAASAVAAPQYVDRRDWFVWTPMVEGDHAVKVTIKPDHESGPETEVSGVLNVHVAARPSNSAVLASPSATYDAADACGDGNVSCCIVNGTWNGRACNQSGHPQVALYTAADCALGNLLQVQFQPDTPGWATSTVTNSVVCGDGLSKNFLVAGMPTCQSPAGSCTPTDMKMRWLEWQKGAVMTGGLVTGFTPGFIPEAPANPNIDTQPPRVFLPTWMVTGSTDDTVASHTFDTLTRQYWVTAKTAAAPTYSDVNDRAIPHWYWHTPTFARELNRPLYPRNNPGGTFFALAADANSCTGAAPYNHCTPYCPAVCAGGRCANCSAPSGSFVPPTVLREVRLDGNPEWETSAAALDVRARALPGKLSHNVLAFHHDAIPLNGGAHVAVISNTTCWGNQAGWDPATDPTCLAYGGNCCPFTYTDSNNVTAPSHIDPSDPSAPPIDILWNADSIDVVDREGNYVWAWSAFNYIPSTRRSPIDYCPPGTTNSTCANGYPICGVTVGFGVSGECTMANTAELTHSNTLNETPDGHLLISVRRHNLVLKINYDHGMGDGSILWALGRLDDPGAPAFPHFSTADASDWFSHQHLPIALGDGSALLLFDNGNNRCADVTPVTPDGLVMDDYACEHSHGIRSRGQVWTLTFHQDGSPDSASVTNYDANVYSAALGSFVKLQTSGNYVANAGFHLIAPPGPRRAYVREVPGTSAPYTYESNGVPTGGTNPGINYRTFRHCNLYDGIQPSEADVTNHCAAAPGTTLPLAD